MHNIARQRFNMRHFLSFRPGGRCSEINRRRWLFLMIRLINYLRMLNNPGEMG
jgi:hypothetical protein